MHVLYMVQQPGSFGSRWGVPSTLHGSLGTVLSHIDITSKAVGSVWSILQMLMDVEITALLLSTQATAPPFSLLKLWPGGQQRGGKVQCPSKSSDPFLEGLSSRDSSGCVTLRQVTCISILFLKAALCSHPALQGAQNCLWQTGESSSCRRDYIWPLFACTISGAVLWKILVQFKWWGAI